MTGTITGTVTAAESGGPLAGAEVSVEGTTHRTATDAQGRYRLSVVPSTYMVEVNTLGRQSAQKQTSVSAGGTSTVNFSLETSPLAVEGIIVNGVTNAGEGDGSGG